MKFSLNNGKLTISAESTAEVKEMLDHYRKDVTQHIDALISGQFEVTTGTERRPYFAQSVSVPFEFLAPYYTLLERVTGYTGEPFTIDNAPRYGDSRSRVNLCHTHIVTYASVDANGMHFEGFNCAEDWNNRTAEENAKRYYAEYVRASIGYTKSEPEFIRTGWGGNMKRNPNYMKRHYPEAKATSASLFEFLFNHWLANVANDAQRVLWAEGEKCFRTVVKAESLASSMVRNYSDNFHIDGYSKSVTFAEFQATK